MVSSSEFGLNPWICGICGLFQFARASQPGVIDLALLLAADLGRGAAKMVLSLVFGAAPDCQRSGCASDLRDRFGARRFSIQSLRFGNLRVSRSEFCRIAVHVWPSGRRSVRIANRFSSSAADLSHAQGTQSRRREPAWALHFVGGIADDVPGNLAVCGP